MNIKHWNTELFFTFYTTVTVSNTLFKIQDSRFKKTLFIPREIVLQQ